MKFEIETEKKRKKRIEEEEINWSSSSWLRKKKLGFWVLEKREGNGGNEKTKPKRKLNRKKSPLIV